MHLMVYIHQLYHFAKRRDPQVRVPPALVKFCSAKTRDKRGHLPANGSKLTEQFCWNHVPSRLLLIGIVLVDRETLGSAYSPAPHLGKEPEQLPLC